MVQTRHFGARTYKSARGNKERKAKTVDINRPKSEPLNHKRAVFNICLHQHSSDTPRSACAASICLQQAFVTNECFVTTELPSNSVLSPVQLDTLPRWKRARVFREPTEEVPAFVLAPTTVGATLPNLHPGCALLQVQVETLIEVEHHGSPMCCVWADA